MFFFYIVNSFVRKKVYWLTYLLTTYLAKNQANGKQHPEAELLVFETYSHCSSTLSSKHSGTYSKNKQRTNVLVLIKLYG